MKIPWMGDNELYAAGEKDNGAGSVLISLDDENSIPVRLPRWYAATPLDGGDSVFRNARCYGDLRHSGIESNLSIKEHHQSARIPGRRGDMLENISWIFALLAHKHGTNASLRFLSLLLQPCQCIGIEIVRLRQSPVLNLRDLTRLSISHTGRHGRGLWHIDRLLQFGKKQY